MDGSTRHTRVPAEVFACLIPGELRLMVLPGVGLAHGGAPFNVRTELVPRGCRLPNSLLWVTIDLARGEVTQVEPRKPGE